ncbi:YbgA family protein [Haliangium sp.]|uniref:YbgA family protein n=1 Tax=Haliangium sp. TaxID=2663208 RepID=UPI003D107EB9
MGVSACLLGEQVRFDGSHKRDRFVSDHLGAHVDWVAVCPEVGAGMGVPRPTLRLVGRPEAPRLVTSRPRPAGPEAVPDRDDWTERVERFSQDTVERLAELDLCGFVLKSRSPTCGMERVRVYGDGGVPAKVGVGVFARVLMERFPSLPVEEEGRLCDPALREAFLDAVFAYARWRTLATQAVQPRALVDFHRRNKLLLRVHSPAETIALGRLVAKAGGRDELDGDDARDREADRDQRYAAYGHRFMRALRTRATPRRHASLLRRITGYLRPFLSPGARTLLHETIDDYAAGLVQRSAPVALLRHHAQEHGLTYLSEQSYLDPYPKALGRM